MVSIPHDYLKIDYLDVNTDPYLWHNLRVVTASINSFLFHHILMALSLAAKMKAFKTTSYTLQATMYVVIYLYLTALPTAD